jgi:acyl-coenzyme A thioesterase 13
LCTRRKPGLSPLASRATLGCKDKQMSTVPHGFEPISRSGPFEEANGPIYFKEENSAVTFGLRIETRHCNSGGTVHGGLIATLCDLALGRNVGFASASPDALAAWRHKEPGAPVRKLVTVSLSLDYAGYARVGDWIEIRTEVQKVGKALAFANAYVFRDDEKIARASAVFRDLADR